MTPQDLFFTLPRTTRPADWFERILPALPLQLPAVTLPHAMAFHVLGAGGGTWSTRLVAGRLQTAPGMVANVAAQVSMSAAHFREALTGALRERLIRVLQKQGRPLALPSFAALPQDPARAAAVAALGGSIALVIADRDYEDSYRFVVTLGGGPAAYDAATTTLEVDADDLATLAAAGMAPLQVLVSGKLRIHGDAALPQRAIAALLGKA